MSTQNKTQSTNQYDPQSMGVFSGLNKTFGSAIQDEIQNPYSSMFFNTQLGMGNQALGAQGASQNQALLQRAQALGINPNSPQYAQMLAQQQRQQQGNQSNMFNNLLLQAAQLRQGAIGQAGAYRPLQTGRTDVQTQSGLGTWLPQLIGAGVGAAGMAFGMPGLGGGGKNSGGGGMNPAWGGSDSFQGGMSGAAPGAGSLYDPSAGPGNPFLGGGR